MYHHNIPNITVYHDVGYAKNISHEFPWYVHDTIFCSAKNLWSPHTIAISHHHDTRPATKRCAWRVKFSKSNSQPGYRKPEDFHGEKMQWIKHGYRKSMEKPLIFNGLVWINHFTVKKCVWFFIVFPVKAIDFKQTWIQIAWIEI